ncbi:MAG: hypothetical protein ACPGQD_07640, partial [Planctomycetota bacterium]
DGSLTGVTTLRLGEARRRPALVSVEALAALTREPEFAALRRGDWKVLYWYERGTWELYDLAADLGEATDLSAQEPEKAASMRHALAAWLRGHEAQRPVQEDTGAMLPYPDPLVD